MPTNEYLAEIGPTLNIDLTDHEYSQFVSLLQIILGFAFVPYSGNRPSNSNPAVWKVFYMIMHALILSSIIW